MDIWVCYFCGILWCFRHIIFREICDSGKYFAWGILRWVLLFVEYYLNGNILYCFVNFYFKQL
jgi:hypothetical protein